MDRIDLILIMPYVFTMYMAIRADRTERRFNRLIDILTKIIEKDGRNESTESN